MPRMLRPRKRPFDVTPAQSFITCDGQSIPGETKMDAVELRATQAPIKERYRPDPKAAIITLKAKGSIDHEGIACTDETGRALALAILHPASAGSRLEHRSGDKLVTALVARARLT